MAYHFPVLIEECEEGGFYGECPHLPGCFIQGETYEETLKELKAAIEGMVEDYLVTGDTLPSKYPILTVITVEN